MANPRPRPTRESAVLRRRPTLQSATLENVLALTEVAKAEQAKYVAERELAAADARQAARREKVFDTRTLVFSAEVEEFGVNEQLERLWDLRTASKKPITIILNSPGGDVFDGLLLFDTVRSIREDDGIEFTVKVRGLAASMGSVLSQAGDHRLISRNSWLMLHEPSTITFGKAGDIKREADLMVKLHKQLSAILAERSALTIAEVIRKSTDKDWWLPAAEAHGLGFFDEVV